jgi:hypothetical protein
VLIADAGSPHPFFDGVLAWLAFTSNTFYVHAVFAVGVLYPALGAKEGYRALSVGSPPAYWRSLPGRHAVNQ